jgi:hypothetical protein
MFDRFRDSLVYPKRIIQYRKDRFIRVFGYMMLFAILMMSANVVLLFRFDRVPQNIRDLYKEDVTTEVIDCLLEDGDVTCEDDGVEAGFYESNLGMVDVFMVVSENPPTRAMSPLQLAIYFNDNEVNAYYGGYQFTSTYDELPSQFKDIDFRDAANNPDAFTDNMMDGFGEFLKSKGHIIAPVILITGFIGNVFMILFVVFMNAIILKMRFKVIPFKETFNMGVYLGTTLYILLVINGFFGLGYFTIFLFLLLTFRQTNQISYEIMKRLKK